MEMIPGSERARGPQAVERSGREQPEIEIRARVAADLKASSMAFSMCAAAGLPPNAEVHSALQYTDRAQQLGASRRGILA